MGRHLEASCQRSQVPTRAVTPLEEQEEEEEEEEKKKKKKGKGVSVRN
jgi:hypothetical protein